MNVSLAMIVKNEERTLGRCLDSVRGAFDEIVVVDTGSEDDTKSVAHRYADKVCDFVWRNDFAAARQFAFDQVMGEWVAWLDADDIVLNAKAIKPLVESASPEVGGFYWRYVCQRDRWGNSQYEFWRERCVRNDGSFRWQGKIHEVLVQSKPSLVLQSDLVTVEHRSKVESGGAKLQRNLAILEEEFASAAEPSPRLLFYLANDYASSGDLGKAAAYYKRCIRSSKWGDERYIAQTRLAALHRSMHKFDQAIAADLNALKTCPHWPDAYFGLAESYYYLGDWHKVIHWTDIGRAMPEPDTLHFVSPMKYRHDWIIFYTNALFHTGETEAALKWTKYALEMCPGAEWHQANFLLFADALGGRDDEAADDETALFSKPVVGITCVPAETLAIQN